MNQLTSSQIYYLLQRFPKIELSYETIPHKKVSTNYNVCLAIPIGVKCYAWFTFYGDHDVCFIMELNKERKINRVSYTVFDSDNKTLNPLALGTILYGTYVNKHFIIEDAFYYKGTPIQGLYYGEKLGFLENMFKKDKPAISISFYLPAMWGMNYKSEYDCNYYIPNEYSDKYPVHHIQYRCLSTIAPYLNVFPAKKGFIQTVNTPSLEIYTPYKSDFSKPQYKMITIFKVTADIQFDIYNLFAYGRNKSCVYYNVAYIPNYKTSVFMNKLFRKIKENDNLDTIEESDDEEDFENIEFDKYVDLKKHIFMECRFNAKFKKWIPIRVVEPQQKVVHISML